MTEIKMYPPSPEFVAHAHIDAAKYKEMYAASMNDPEAFWAEQAKRLDWAKAPSKIKNTSFDYPNVSIKWFEDGALNVTVNCIDRHLPARTDQTAILWERDDPRGSLCHAGLRADRCHPLDCFRRIFPRGAGQQDLR